MIVPQVASVLSAQGAAISDVRRERVRTVLEPMPVDVVALEKIGEELATLVDSDLEADGVAAADRRVTLEADLRFVRQMWELTIPLPSGSGDEVVDRLLEGFREEYAKRYGAGSITLGTPAELVAVRALGIGSTIHGEFAPQLADTAPKGDVRSGRTRTVRFGSAEDASVDVDVYDDAQISVGHLLSGPALIDRSDTTIWVPEDVQASRDGNGSIVLEVR